MRIFAAKNVLKGFNISVHPRTSAAKNVLKGFNICVACTDARKGREQDAEASICIYLRPIKVLVFFKY